VRKRLPTLLLGGHLLLALTPIAAQAAPAPPPGPAAATESADAQHYGCHGQDCGDHRDDHYRCMYHCEERYGRGYDRSRHDYRYDHSRDRRDRVYHHGQCYEHDWSGWHRCGYRYRWWGFEGD
jgi:hypothetical protein